MEKFKLERRIVRGTDKFLYELNKIYRDKKEFSTGRM